ncbi:MAG TPA: DUF3540 domain-containing protein [Byssovorax sp.]|jgi:hypothetical protein
MSTAPKPHAATADEPDASAVVGDVSDYLGPAEVVAVEAHVVLAELPRGGVVRARLALAFPYEPAIGDSLLVIGKGEAHFVIGVLDGAGKTVLTLPGDAAIRATGELHLSGDKGVRIAGPAVEVEATKLRVVADAVTERFRSAFQRVTEMLQVHAGQSSTLVDDAAYTQAKTAAIVTEGTITINGDEVHLG